eukprot:2658713-Prymnesium_polylepis.1
MRTSQREFNEAGVNVGDVNLGTERPRSASWCLPDRSLREEEMTNTRGLSGDACFGEHQGSAAPPDLASSV